MHTHTHTHIDKYTQPLQRETFGVPPTGIEWVTPCIYLLTSTWEAQQKKRINENLTGQHGQLEQKSKKNAAPEHSNEKCPFLK